jgi:peptide-methionine (R)-S-oxide reductase
MSSRHRVHRTDEEWRRLLTPERYRVLRQGGTERAFTGAFWQSHEEATYLCGGCGEPLFDSTAKYDSGSGWPSFWQPLSDGALATERDLSLGMERIELKCAACGGHLGHVFDDGPAPTGLRYCINSLSLEQKRR